MESTVTPRAMDERDAATYIGMSAQFLRKQRHEGARRGRAGVIPYVRLGRAIRYKIADLDDWLDAHTVTPGADGN